MKKVLFILPSLNSGGAENYALRFINHNKDYFDFHVLSVVLEKGDLQNEFNEINIPVHYKSIGYFNFKKAVIFFKFLRQNQFDTICGFNGNFDGLPITIAKLVGVKNKISFYRRSTNAFEKNKFKNLYNNWVKCLVRKNANLILSNSQFAFDNFFPKIYKENSKFKVIRNGVQASKFNSRFSKEEARRQLNIPVKSFIVGHVGRMDPAKNHNTIFKVAQELLKSRTDVVFLFCGKGTDSQIFIEEIHKFGIEENVITLGLRQDLSLIYKAMDVFYFPSITEGQPNALIEAMVSGLPILTSNIAPILEALPLSGSSFTVDPLSVPTAVHVLESFYKNQIEHSNYIYQNWAIKNFDVNRNYQLFKELL